MHQQLSYIQDISVVVSVSTDNRSPFVSGDTDNNAVSESQRFIWFESGGCFGYSYGYFWKYERSNDCGGGKGGGFNIEFLVFFEVKAPTIYEILGAFYGLNLPRNFIPKR